MVPQTLELVNEGPSPGKEARGFDDLPDFGDDPKIR